MRSAALTLHLNQGVIAAPLSMPSPAQTAVSKPAISLASSSLLAAVAGGLGGGLAALLMLGLDGLQSWVWGQSVSQGLANQRPLLWCLAVPALTGLLLSRLVWQGQRSLLPEFAETMAALRRNEPAPQRPGSGIRPILGSVLALVAGASLGPEALITYVVTRVSRLIWRGQDQRVSVAAISGSLALFQTPLVGPSVLLEQRGQLLWRWLPGTLAAVAGFACFQGLQALGQGLEGVPYALPLVDGRAPTALLSALLGGLLGCGFGALLRLWRGWLHGLLERRRWPWAPLGTGIVLGLALWALPLAAFSGEHQIRPLVLGQWSLSPGLLILSGAAKLLLVGLCLETGWRGGQSFPVILGSGAIGLGLHALMPQLGTAAIWGGSVVGGCLGLVIPSPLVALVLGLTLLRGHGAIALLVGILISQIARRIYGPDMPSRGSSTP